MVVIFKITQQYIPLCCHTRHCCKHTSKSSIWINSMFTIKPNYDLSLQLHIIMQIKVTCCKIRWLEHMLLLPKKAVYIVKYPNNIFKAHYNRVLINLFIFLDLIHFIIMLYESLKLHGGSRTKEATTFLFCPNSILTSKNLYHYPWQ